MDGELNDLARWSLVLLRVDTEYGFGTWVGPCRVRGNIGPKHRSGEVAVNEEEIFFFCVFFLRVRGEILLPTYV